MPDAQRKHRGLALLAAPALAALAAGGVLFAAKLAGFTGSVGAYHAAVFAAFYALYNFIPGGFEKHFNTPGPVTAGDVGYFTAITHATVGYGDVYPKTTAARMLVVAHVLLVFAVAANIVPIGHTVFSYSTFVGGD